VIRGELRQRTVAQPIDAAVASVPDHDAIVVARRELDERDGRAQRPRPPADDDVSSAEQVLMSVLGAVRIA